MKALKTLAVAVFATTVIAACSTSTSNPIPIMRPGKQMNQTHSVDSRYTFDETVNRLQNAVKEKGMNVFAVIDHQAAAKESGLDMQPAKVIVFGTPKAGTPLMVKDPEFALQLPLRVLVTEADGRAKVVFNDTRALIAGSKIDYAEVENALANAEKLIRKVAIINK
ncbi:DUF302 domain-containing protein [Neisseria sp. N95_16]|uniref:DUF302 domain-containing protein n=1 Tax=Neisseria brasiliensis TaxID=2666100 RepID=A0A7X2H0L1_9NEIS|nr:MULTISPECIES: DUF302 domain-containing protein [Neisseria]MRN39371.1 DUF302 domain-containing protein [Neisseria brasiliensis]PJO09927.1 DUF302 domain-containing protein [Neisseria sp. N95_16]